MSEKEKKDKKMGMITSGVFHGLILVLFLILVAWREPNPPLPEYGIELNLGFEEAGSGDTQSTESAEVENTEEETPSAEEEAEAVEEEIVEADPAEEVVEPEEEVQEADPVVEAPAEETPVETAEVEQVVETQVEESDVKIEEKKEEVKEVVEEEVKEEVPPPPVEEKKEEVKPPPVPVVDARALMGGKKSDSKTDASSKSEGTDANKVGNEGDPEGAVDQRGLMAGGGEGGPMLDLAGWEWENEPNPDDNSQESGKIVFKITIDDSGRVETIKIEKQEVSNALVQVYMNEVRKLTFRRKGSNTRSAIRYEGKITFIIKTN